ncbi:unnamed protein product, partial [Pleuronectes platessa]
MLFLSRKQETYADLKSKKAEDKREEKKKRKEYDGEGEQSPPEDCGAQLWQDGRSSQKVSCDTYGK